MEYGSSLALLTLQMSASGLASRAALCGIFLAEFVATAETAPSLQATGAKEAKANFQRLVDWTQRGIDTYVLQDGQADLPRLAEVLDAQVTEDGERTVVAARDVRAGELLLRLPTQILMHAGYYKTATGQPTALALQSPDGSVSSRLAPALKASLSGGADLFTFVAPQTWLALYLMEHRRLGSASEWSPYIDALPRYFPGLPIFYTEDEWKWLEGSTFPQRVRKHRESLAKQFETVADLVQGFRENYTVEEYMWARSAISSRVFGWQLPGLPDEDETEFLVPLGDMFNHRSPKQIEWIFNATLGTLDYWARENVTEGSELLISYGAKCNSQYLLHYGFALPGVSAREPPLSTVRVEMAVDEAVPDRENRLTWLAKSRLLDKGEPLPPEEFELKAQWRGSGPESMLGYARLLSIATAEEFAGRLKSGGSCRAFSTPPRCESALSVANERAALGRCLAAVEGALAAYATTAEEDEALIPALGGVPRSLAILRRDEKLVLRWWARYWGLALEGLELSAEDLASRATQEFGEFSPESKYFKVTLSALLAVERGQRPAEL